MRKAQLANLALDPASEQPILRGFNRGHFTKPAEVVASALRLLNSHEDWLQENREAISERPDLSFEQSRTAKTCTPDQARQLLAERRASRQEPSTTPATPAETDRPLLTNIPLGTPLQSPTRLPRRIARSGRDISLVQT